MYNFLSAHHKLHVKKGKTTEPNNQTRREARRPKAKSSPPRTKSTQRVNVWIISVPFGQFYSKGRFQTPGVLPSCYYYYYYYYSYYYTTTHYTTYYTTTTTFHCQRHAKATAREIRRAQMASARIQHARSGASHLKQRGRAPTGAAAQRHQRGEGGTQHLGHSRRQPAERGAPGRARSARHAAQTGRA